MTERYGRWTYVDITRSMAYAQAQVDKLRCQDSNNTDYICGDGDTSCIKWKNDVTHVTWAPLSTLSNTKCYADNDCVGKDSINFDKVGDSRCVINEDKLSGVCGYVSGHKTNNVAVDRKFDDMKSGQCVITSKQLCKQKSSYKLDNIENDVVVPGTSARKFTDNIADSTGYHGICLPSTCDPDEENCSPKSCLPYNCTEDSQCDGKGMDKKCLPNGFCKKSTTDFVCDSDQDCGDRGRCSLTGKYNLTEEQRQCWDDSGETNDIGEYKNPGKKCDKTVTTGYCYGSGSCPEPIPELDTERVYLEWYPNAGACDNVDKFCRPGSICNLLKGVCTCISDDNCHGNSTCNNGECTNGADTGQCVYGNEPLREFCENPQCRGGASTEAPGNNLPPFTYDVSSGGCYINSKYCKIGSVDFGRSEDMNDPDEKDTDTSYASGCEPEQGAIDEGGSGSSEYKSGCKDNWFCAKNKSGFNDQPNDWSCTGPGAQCNLDNEGDKFWELVIGTSFYKKIQGKCDGSAGNLDKFHHRPPPDPYVEKPKIKMVRGVLEGMTSLPSTVTSLCDKNKIKVSTLLVKDFAYGLDLMTLGFKNNTASIGLDYDQVKSKHPELLKKRSGVWYVEITSDMRSKSKDLMKLYVILGSKIK
jgi:hypothetical protein